MTAVVLLGKIHATTRHWPRGQSLRLAPANRWAYLLMLLALGLFAMVLVLDVAGHLGIGRGIHAPVRMAPRESSSLRGDRREL